MSRVHFPVLVTTALLLAGCGGADAPPTAAEPPVTTRAATPSTETSAAPSAGPTPALSERPSPEPAKPSRDKPKDKGSKIPPIYAPLVRPDGSRTHLLSSDTLPAHAREGGWTTTSTRPETGRPVGACQKASMGDIGALHAVVRTWDGGDGVRARQVVARFADGKSAWRAHEVLRSWRDGCEKWLDEPNPSVTPMSDVETDRGTGGHYRASFGPKKDTDASGLGIVRKGRWLSIVAVSDVSQAWTKRAVRRIAATF